MNQPLFDARTFEGLGRSGETFAWKIECDALTAEDWTGLARMAVELLPPFGVVLGVPRGGIPFANALQSHVTEGPLLIADDVLLTGGSMAEWRAKVLADIGRPGDGFGEPIGVVAFDRCKVPVTDVDWIVSVFTFGAGRVGTSDGGSVR